MTARFFFLTFLLWGLVSIAPARAGIILTIVDDGTHLIMRGRGTYDLTGLTPSMGQEFASDGSIPAAIAPDFAGGVFGWDTGVGDAYAVTVTGRLTGTGIDTSAEFSSIKNPFYVIHDRSQIHFAAGADQIGSVDEFAFFENTTLADLGMVPGESMVYRWANDFAVIATGTPSTPVSLPSFAVTAVPEPGSIGLGCLLCLAGWRRRLARRVAAGAV